MNNIYFILKLITNIIPFYSSYFYYYLIMYMLIIKWTLIENIFFLIVKRYNYYYNEKNIKDKSGFLNDVKIKKKKGLKLRDSKF